MKVSRIEIFGFKSFMDRLTLPLEAGITGVVGPNGCGKSNVVDAIRWIFGETKASNLRGGTLEDVIFNGTDKLRPLGLAEVTMTLRATEDNFFADLVSPEAEAQILVDEVLQESEESTVEPELEEGAEQEEEAASEITNTTADGRPRLTVIEGSLGKQVTDEPEAEDAAEKAEAVIKKAHAKLSLAAKFSWLQSANEAQITRRLYRSGESEFFINRVPCRLKDIKELFRAVGLGARAYSIVAQGEVSRIVTAKPEDRRLILEEAAGVLGFRDKIASAQRRLEETTTNLTRLDDVLQEVTRQVSGLKRQAQRARDRQEIKNRVTELEQALFAHEMVVLTQRLAAQQAEMGVVREKEATCAAHLSLVQAEEVAARSALFGFDVEGDALRSQIDAIREELANRARKKSDHIAKINQLSAYEAATEKEGERMQERKEMLLARKADSERRLEDLTKTEQDLAAEIQVVESGKEDEIRALSKELDGLRAELRVKEQEIAKARETMAMHQSGLAVIEEQIVAASPLAKMREALETNSDSRLHGVLQNAALLSDCVKVPGDLTKAMQAVLGERAQYLIAENLQTVATTYVQELPSLNEDLHGIGVFAGQVQAHNEAHTAQVSGALRLVEALSFPEDKREFFTALLGHVFVVSDIAEAFAHFEHVPGSRALFVTRDGDLVAADSFTSMRHEGGILQLKQRADELAIRVTEVKAQVAEATAVRDEQSKVIEAKELHLREMLAESQRLQATAKELSNQLGSIRGQLQAERSLLQQIHSDVGTTDNQLADLQTRRAQYQEQSRLATVEMDSDGAEEETQLKEELQRLQTEFSGLDSSRREEREKLSQCALAVESARSALDQARSRVSEASLGAQKLELEGRALEERILFECGEDGLPAVRDRAERGEEFEADVAAEHKAEVQRLKNKIHREGDVDPAAIERYDEESARLEDLTAQQKDLQEAKMTLLRTIQVLTDTSEKRFMATFKAVRKNFSRLMPRLFGGGKGDLSLSDMDRPLEAGVEILVRPPGKKPKSIELLSGGEKALCATALIFAMFLVRPSPLCILDEVDAPLDEANLVRFVEMIKEMSARTQFLVITHNKQTMALADRLIGVTMQQPGASKVITVSLQEAYSHVA